MLGDFVNRILVLILGYAYPGFECYKTVEKNRVDIEELRFWCKYWIIVALFTVMEKFTDIFVGWVPMYGEMKLVLFVYLWYPKTKGSGFVYESLLRPYISKHENDIDRTLMEWKARGWDYVAFYGQYCAKFGQTAFVQALQHVASQTTKFSTNPTTTKKTGTESKGQSATQEPQTQSQPTLLKQSSTVSMSKKGPATTNNEETMEVRQVQSEYVYREDEEPSEPEPVKIDGQDQSVSVKDRISHARARIRQLDSQQQQLSPRTPRTPRTPQTPPPPRRQLV